ncbi:MAG TPA: creatininase family protein [Gemmatimonadales bacterium]|nr:creatininase family protein [Gemmatimonadales bacterium]
MPVLELARLTWGDVRALDRAKTIAVLPVGAIEAHGPHLPLATDVIIAEAMARAGADQLAARGHEVLALPAVVYTAAGFAAAFPGTLAPAPGTITELIVGIAGSLARHEFPALAIANAHLDPAHLDALHAAVERIRERQVARVVFPDLTRKPWASRLTAEFKSGACHAGQFETSVVLAARPSEVREEVRRDLSPNPRSLSAAIAAGAKTFEEAGGSQAYFGFPADATAQEGRQTIAMLGAILAEAVLAELGR